MQDPKEVGGHARRVRHPAPLRLALAGSIPEDGRRGDPSPSCLPEDEAATSQGLGLTSPNPVARSEAPALLCQRCQAARCGSPWQPPWGLREAGGGRGQALGGC